MQAIKLPGHNLTLAEGQPEYQQLPVCWQGGPSVPMTSGYKLTWRERLKVFFRGRVYVTQLTFGCAYQPQAVHVDWKEPQCVNCGRPIGEHKHKRNFTCPPKLN